MTTVTQAGKYLGNTRKLTAAFVDENGDTLDPTTVSLYVVDPDGTESDEYTYAGGDVIKLETGSYYMYYTPDAGGTAGTWQAQWTATTGSKVFTAVETFAVYDPAVSLA